MIEREIPETQIKLDTGSQDPVFGRIYDDSVGELIATTRHHEGIAFEVDGEELVFDNLHPEGIPCAAWMQNLYSPILEAGRKFEVTEVGF